MDRNRSDHASLRLEASRVHTLLLVEKQNAGRKKLLLQSADAQKEARHQADCIVLRRQPRAALERNAFSRAKSSKPFCRDCRRNRAESGMGVWMSPAQSRQWNL